MLFILTLLYTNFYTNFVTKELCLANGLAGINHCVQSEKSLLLKNLDFLKNAARNFNFILRYLIFTLIWKNKYRLNFPFSSLYS